MGQRTSERKKLCIMQTEKKNYDEDRGFIANLTFKIESIKEPIVQF